MKHYLLIILSLLSFSLLNADTSFEGWMQDEDFNDSFEKDFIQFCQDRGCIKGYIQQLIDKKKDIPEEMKSLWVSIKKILKDLEKDPVDLNDLNYCGGKNFKSSLVKQRIKDFIDKNQPLLEFSWDNWE